MRLPTRKAEKEKNATFQQDHHLSVATIERMKKTLIDLEKKQRPEAIEEVQRTQEMGDLSENAAYQEAKFHLRRINSQILILEERLKNAIPIKKDNSGRVQIGSHVTVLIDDKQRAYKILDSQESDPFKGCISYLSPIGSALMGHIVDDVVRVEHGNTSSEYRILSVE